MLREESDVNTYKHNIEVGFRSPGVKSDPSKQRKPVVESRKQSKDSTHGKHVMEMGNYIVSVMQHNIQRGIRKDNTSKTPYSKKENKP